MYVLSINTINSKLIIIDCNLNLEICKSYKMIPKLFIYVNQLTDLIIKDLLKWETPLKILKLK